MGEAPEFFVSTPITAMTLAIELPGSGTALWDRPAGYAARESGTWETGNVSDIKEGNTRKLRAESLAFSRRFRGQFGADHGGAGATQATRGRLAAMLCTW